MSENPYESPGLYLADCMEAMAHFPDGFFDLAVVDPPYGIGIGHKMGNNRSVLVGGGARPCGIRKAGYRKTTFTVAAWTSNPYVAFDDSAPPDESYFRALRRVSRYQIIWGGNFFLDYLGRASCMIVWDKKRRNMDQADCEIAWTNLPGQSRIFEYLWNGMFQAEQRNKEQRIHPTQKPVALYRWILDRYAKPGMRILDTHAGSASSLVACHEAGLDAWGFEISPDYHRMATERLEKARAQVSIAELLRAPEPEQMTLNV